MHFCGIFGLSSVLYKQKVNEEPIDLSSAASKVSFEIERKKRVSCLGEFYFDYRDKSVLLAPLKFSDNQNSNSGNRVTQLKTEYSTERNFFGRDLGPRK